MIKAIITDLDNTLWDGIIGESDLTLNKNYYELLKDLYARGIVLIIVSKNDRKDVDKTFKKLKISEKFFITIANWDPKYLTLEQILQKTKLKPEAVHFVDDNEAELLEVKKKIPNIKILNALNWKKLQRFQELPVQQSKEVQQRIARYKTALKNFRIICDPKFEKGLERKITIKKIDPDYLERIAKLFYMTHRLNFNPKFDDYKETMQYLHKKLNEDYAIYGISACEDNYDLGLIGAMVVEKEDKITITDATFSCGIIGRGFEQAAIAEITKGYKVEIHITPTNIRIRTMLKEMGFKEKTKTLYEANTVKNPYPWIKIEEKELRTEYNGIPEIIKFYNEIVKPKIRKNNIIVNLGAARGETLGLLQQKEKDDFYNYLEELNINYKKIDLIYYPEEKNIIGDAESLDLKDETADMLFAFELLEHTEHYWNVLHEMQRVCKIGGHVAITVPSNNYPKHEYPIDRWRIGPKTLQQFFPKEAYEILYLKVIGNWRTLLLVQKKKNGKYGEHTNGQTDWEVGLTVLP